MTENKITIEQYFDGFINFDVENILSCLTDNVFWEIPGVFQVKGKEAFLKMFENSYFEGSPAIKIMRMIEENDMVAAEGYIQSNRKEGGVFNAVFCDIFLMEKGKIKQLTTYLIEEQKQND